jgi:hypothetical protein
MGITFDISNLSFKELALLQKQIDAQIKELKRVKASEQMERDGFVTSDVPLHIHGSTLMMLYRIVNVFTHDQRLREIDYTRIETSENHIPNWYPLFDRVGTIEKEEFLEVCDCVRDGYVLDCISTVYLYHIPKPKPFHLFTTIVDNELVNVDPTTLSSDWDGLVLPFQKNLEMTICDFHEEKIKDAWRKQFL